MADMLDGDTSDLIPPSPEDFVDYIKGKGTPEQKKRVQAALNDPDSDLNSWLKDLAQWGEDSFQSQRKRSDDFLPNERRSESSNKLDIVIEFVRQKRAANIFTDEDVSLITTAAGFDEGASIPLSPIESIAVATRMI
ncbi:MAG TPA: hypothetical protein VK642_09100, partial [Burkholderiales bacterium]|nr:hypothetical protein [Burkholderiales bacterium]